MSQEKNNSFVKKSITQSLLKRMENQPFEEITITDIVKDAMVGRASFYRNFTSKEDVLKQYLMLLIKEWGTEFEQGDDPNWLKSLLKHYKKYSEFYFLLYQSGLSFLVLDNIRAISGPKPEQDDIQSYFSAWFAGGVFGFIDEWIKRGMKQDPDEMAKLLEEADRRSKE